MKLQLQTGVNDLTPKFSYTPVRAAILQRKCACGQHTTAGGECESCRQKREGTLQRAAISSPPVVEAPPIVHDVLRSPGQPLDAGTRAFMEPRFGHDFSGVRVHTGEHAAESARAVHALAYTVGRDVVFGAGQYVPQTNAGRRLLAHELTHMIQQTSSGSSPTVSPIRVNEPHDVYEHEADDRADAIEQGNSYTAKPNGSVDKTIAVTSPNAAPVHMLQRQSALSMRSLPFDDEPPQLRSILEASYTAGKFGCAKGSGAADCYDRLEASARIVLKSLYNRLSRFGLWEHLLYVGGIWTSGVGGAHFTVKDHVKFLDALLVSTRFCIDSAAGGMLHRGSTSVREISSSDSLHLSLSSGNNVSAHIDAISPAAGRESNFRCRYDPIAAAAHIGREALPEVLKLPGLQIFPEPRPTFGLPERGEAPPEIIRLEIFRF